MARSDRAVGSEPTLYSLNRLIARVLDDFGRISYYISTKSRTTFLKQLGRMGPELRSVEFTAAPNDNSQLLAVDATAASFSEGESTAVGTPQQVETRFPNRVRKG